MVARRTYSEKRWPDTPEFNSVLHSWKQAGSEVLLALVWKAYDRFCEEILSQVDCSKEDEDLERDITQLFEPKIREVMTRYEPFYVQHESPEHESRKDAPAQPPHYDIAFILWSHPRVKWPLEAKVLRTDKRVAEYVKEIQHNFLTSRYSPFSSEAAMLGYLLAGDCEVAFANIAKEGKWKLIVHEHFRKRSHKMSDHERKVPEGKSYPIHFRCHHILFNFRIR